MHQFFYVWLLLLYILRLCCISCNGVPLCANIHLMQDSLPQQRCPLINLTLPPPPKKPACHWYIFLNIHNWNQNIALSWLDMHTLAWAVSQHKNTKATTEHGYVLHTNVGTIFSYDYLLVLTASTLQKRRELLCRWCMAAHVAGVIKTGHTLNALTIWNALVSVQLHILSVQLGNSTTWTTLTCKFVF